MDDFVKPDVQSLTNIYDLQSMLLEYEKNNRKYNFIINNTEYVMNYGPIYFTGNYKYVYYLKNDKDLYRAELKNITETEELIDKDIESYFIKDNDLYYCKQNTEKEENTDLYKNGVLLKEDVGSLQLAEEKIYYERSGKLYCIDNNKCIELIDNVYSCKLYDDLIVYYDRNSITSDGNMDLYIYKNGKSIKVDNIINYGFKVYSIR